MMKNLKKKKKRPSSEAKEREYLIDKLVLLRFTKCRFSSSPVTYDMLYPPEFQHALKMSGMTPTELKFKVGKIIVLYKILNYTVDQDY